MRLAALSFSLGLMLATGAAAQDAPARLSQLHEALHLTADQESAWSDYAAAVTPSPDAQARRRATQRLLPGLTTPRRIALIDAAMDRDNADLHRQGDAVLHFYGRLTPDQQRTFDRQSMVQATGPSRPGAAEADGSAEHPLKLPPADH
jgi:hypothetical protein